MTGVDLHTHLAPRLDGRGVPGVAGRDGRLVVDGRPIGPDALYRPEDLLAHLDAAGLDTAVVSLPPPFFRQQLTPDECAGWVRAANDGLRAATGDRPRLRPLAYLPLEHPGVARAEYARVRDETGWAGVSAGVGGGSRSLADPELEPLWAALDADSAPLLLHPGPSPDERLAPYYLGNLLGNPVETALGAAQLIFGGVLDRHPGLRVLLVHCGGVLPAVLGRWRRGAETARPGLPDGAAPIESARRFWVDCLAHDPDLLDLAVRTFGPEKIVIGSDWPFPMGHPDPRSLVAHRGGGFADRAAGDNAAALLSR